MTLDAARCYEALLSRDRRFDGRFFVGVVTTGVYCRPICPARPAHPTNVRFFACAAAAEAAGFRPCRRCHPEAAPGTPAWNGTSSVVARALRLIGERALDQAPVDRLAARLGVGDRHLRRLFAQHLGASPAQVARARRVHFARTLLDDTALPVAHVAYAAGFRSLRQFNRAMLGTFGRPPRRLRREAAAGPPAGRDPRNGLDLSLRLAYRPPLDWARLCAFLAARAIPGVEQVDNAGYRRTIDMDGRAGVIDVRNDAAASELTLRIDASGWSGLLPLVARARRLFDLDADPWLVAARLGRSSLRRLGFRNGLRVPGAWDPFEIAVRAVLGQRITVRGATTLASRLANRFGRPVTGWEHRGLTRLWPRPDDLAGADLEAVGLPRARACTIRHLARAVADGALRLEASQSLDRVVSRLRAVPGIGPWTASYIALRALGEPDAFPAGDLGLRKAVGDGHGPVTPSELERMAEDWRPWRAYAAVALWTAGSGRPTAEDTAEVNRR